MAIPALPPIEASFAPPYTPLETFTDPDSGEVVRVILVDGEIMEFTSDPYEWALIMNAFERARSKIEEGTDD